MKLQLCETLDPPEDALLREGLRAHWVAHAVPERGERALIVVQRDEAGGSMLAALRGRTFWGWFHARHLWVSEPLRGQGIGRKLKLAAEEEARRRGCRAAYIDTFSFQALDFYRKLGYEVFGALEEFPPGHSRHFLRKTL